MGRDAGLLPRFGGVLSSLPSSRRDGRKSWTVVGYLAEKGVFTGPIRVGQGSVIGYETNIKLMEDYWYCVEI